MPAPHLNDDCILWWPELRLQQQLKGLPLGPHLHQTSSVACIGTSMLRNSTAKTRPERLPPSHKAGLALWQCTALAVMGLYSVCRLQLMHAVHSL